MSKRGRKLPMTKSKNNICFKLCVTIAINKSTILDK